MSIKSDIKERLYAYRNRKSERNYEQGMKAKIAQCRPDPLSREQIQSIQDFWQPLMGRKVTTLWHQYFTARNSNFSPLYVPSSIYYTELIYRLNFFPFRKAYVDKAFYDVIFKDVNRPRTIVRNMNGYFYDAQGTPLTPQEALLLSRDLPFAVIKPAQEGKWGEGVRVVRTQDGMVLGGNTSVEQLFQEYGMNFILQEKIEQHEDMARLNPDSVNTLRVLTYRRENEVIVLYAVIRIGRKGKMVDNETAGGINADVDIATGRIIECAYGTPSEKKILHTDVGTELKDYSIPSVDKVLATARRLHLTLPYFNLIGWDFTVDKDGEPVLIEYNRCPDLSQTAHGPAFGQHTEEIIRTALSRPNTVQFYL